VLREEWSFHARRRERIRARLGPVVERQLTSGDPVHAAEQLRPVIAGLGRQERPVAAWILRDLTRGADEPTRARVRAVLDETGAIDHELRPGWPTARIAFVPDAVCWTQAPHTLAGLRTQRIRWQVGLLETMRLHIGMSGRRRFGAVGCWPSRTRIPRGVRRRRRGLRLRGRDRPRRPRPEPVALPGRPVRRHHPVRPDAERDALLVEETGFRRYGRAGTTRLLGWSLLECLWYRPLLALWRTWGTFSLLVGRRPAWGTIPRRAFDEAPAESVVPLTR